MGTEEGKEVLKGKPLVILDLDNTCISAKELSELKHVPYPEQFRYDDLDRDYRIFERPALQEFLTHLFRYYRVAVWTAAGLSYALFVVKKFILNDRPERQLEFFMWDQHCDYSSDHSKDEQPKNLALLVPLYNAMVLIDDNEEVLKQMEDTIDSQYFDASKEHAHSDLYFPDTCRLLIENHFLRLRKLDVLATIKNRLETI